MRCIELCAGDGGGLLANLILGHTTICAVEREPHCQAVLRARQKQNFLPEFPIHDDVRTFDGRPWRGSVDVLSGGIPCQGFSGAGKQLGEFDPRNLWPDALRILKECRAPWFFLENVDRLTSFDYWGVILQDLASAGYDARWCVFSAGDVGAPHLRKRIWLLATDTGAFVADTGCERGDERRTEPGENQSGPELHDQRCHEDAAGSCRCASRGKVCEPGVDRLADGLATELERSEWWSNEHGIPRLAGDYEERDQRLRGLGNGQVPLCKAVAWKLLGGPDSITHQKPPSNVCAGKENETMSLKQAHDMLANLQAMADTILDQQVPDRDAIERFMVSARNIARDARQEIIDYSIEHIDGDRP